MDQAERCLKCGAILSGDASLYTSAMRKADEKRQWHAWLIIRGGCERAWLRMPLRRFWNLPEDVRYRHPFIAGLLSILPGLGQMYNHQWPKAGLLAAVWWGWAFVCLETFTEWHSNILLLALLVMWLFIWNDAIITAIRINGQQWTFRNSVALFFALVFVSGVIFTAAQILLPFILLVILLMWSRLSSDTRDFNPRRWPARVWVNAGAAILMLVLVYIGARHFQAQNFFTLVRIMKKTHEPAIHRGDLVVVDNTQYFIYEPRFGDVAHFDPPGFMIEAQKEFSADYYAIDIQDYFQRIIGEPGDTIVKRDGRLYRNGNPLTPEFEPFAPKDMLDGKYEVPPDCYFLPVTKVPYDFLASLIGGDASQFSIATSTLKGWREAAMVPRSAIFGRVSCILNPPQHRQWMH